MIIVIDTNILISALIKDSITRRLIVSSGMNFCYPEISLHEIRKHKKLIMEKSGLSEKELGSLIERVLEYIVLIPTEVITEHIGEARSVMLKIDTKDVVFIATALSFKNSIIWSDDKDFERQNAIKVITTKQFAKMFEK